MGFPHYMCATEKRIVGDIIRRALETGFKISVYDGEEWPVKVSTDFDAIATEVAATDLTTLRFRREIEAEGKISRPIVGDVILVHGNGHDVVGDFTDNAEMEALCAA